MGRTPLVRLVRSLWNLPYLTFQGPAPDTAYARRRFATSMTDRSSLVVLAFIHWEWKSGSWRI